MTFLKKIGGAFFILLITTAIFYFLVKDQQVKDDILKTTLELFGEQLLDMVPAGEPRQALENKLNEFLQRAEQDEIAPEEIEQVAANILNLTTQDSIVSVELALSAFEPEPVMPDLDELVLLGEEAPEPENVQAPPVVFNKRREKRILIPESDREKLAHNLRELHNLSIHIRETSKYDSAYKDVQKQLVFLADSGLKVAMSLELKDDIPQEDLHELQATLHQLEKEKMVEWRDDMRMKRRIVLESLLDLDEFDDYMHPSQFLAGRGAFRHIHPHTIDSLAVANPDSFKVLLREHLEGFMPPPKMSGRRN